MDKSFRQAFCKRRQELIVYAFADLWLFPSLERAFKAYFKPFQPLYTCKVVSTLSYLCNLLQITKSCQNVNLTECRLFKNLVK